MKKIISFEKELDFPSMIGEITSISLDNSLNFIDNNNIEGNFLISGTYKMTEASALEEEFKYDIPVDITLTESFDLNNVKISIDDFNYQIVNDDILKCNIDVLIDGLEEIILEEEKRIIDEIEESEEEIENMKEEELLRECDGDKKELKEIDIEINKREEIIEQEKEDQQKKQELIKEEEMEEENKNISSLFESLATADETFTTYSIYIYRKEDTIEKILEKYNTTMEELNDYNDLNNIEIGSKIIIPNTINE